MRTIGPMCSTESSILSTLRGNRRARTFTVPCLLVVALASLSVADEPVSSRQSQEEPTSGVTIRLELQPSAPEAEQPISDAPQPAEPQRPVDQKAVELKVSPRTVETKTVVETKPKSPVSSESAPPQLQLSTSRSSRDVGTKRTLPTLAAPSQSQLPASTEQSTQPMQLPAGRALNKLDSGRGSAEQAVVPMELKSQRSAVSSVKLPDEKVDRDFSNERSEHETNGALDLELEPDDVPLEQEEHPFDAPAAKPTELESAPSSAAPIISKAEIETTQFSPRELRIKTGIQHCLNYYLTHPENTVRRGPWALMHATLPFGVESEVIAGNRRVNTIGWLSFNGTCGKQNMFQPTRQGFRPNVGPGVQGHDGQFLAILAQSRVQADYPLQINQRRYTVMDLARYEMATCREKSELTFKLIGLSHYLEPEQRWRDDRGRTWTLEKMVGEELAQPINGAACGGVHRLMGLSYSLIQRQEAGQPITGHWRRAEAYVSDYVNYTMSFQNPDGSFSTNWLESRGMDPDVERKVQTTGHILEWLVYTLPDDHLRSPRIQLSLEFLLDTVGREPQKDWPIGPRGHALRAMALYSQRVFGAQVGQLKSYVAEAAGPSRLR